MGGRGPPAAARAGADSTPGSRSPGAPGRPFPADLAAAQAEADADHYNRVAQLGPPERVLGCPVPTRSDAGPAGGDATPIIPRGKALVDPHPPAPEERL